MKNLNCIPFIVAVLFGFGVLASSCSQSSSSTSGPDEEIASSDSSDTDTEKSAGSTGKKTNDGKKTSAKSHEERTYKTLDRGPITWMTENLDEGNAINVKGTCYGYDDEKCDKYGRLYMSHDKSKPSSLCPLGFDLPYSGLWKDLVDNDVDFDPVLAGVCDLKDSLECSGLGETARYLAYGDEAVVLTKDANGKLTYKVQETSDKEFYSVRCVKYRSMVETLDDLPKCDSSLSNMFRISVLEKGMSYACSQETLQWVASSMSEMVCNDPKGVLYHSKSGALLACEELDWVMATPVHLQIPCNEDSLYKEYVVNNNHFVCLWDGWTMLSYPDSVIGYCGSKESMGKVAQASENYTYICKSDGWTLANITDVYGECNREGRIETVEFNSRQWTCNGNGSWSKEP